MCGFVGYINKNTKDKKIIKAMNDMIAHRGPDDEQYYLDEDISLGFRRLAIIDLKSGVQPMERDNLVIVFNGEIYNFLDLRKELERKYDLKTNSDTEVLLYAYKEYGNNVLKKIRGMFAFVIWDKNTKTLFGARDHFGIKPFYYTLMNNTFMFGSEIKSFLKHPDFNKEVNKEALKPYLTFQYSVLDETFFKGVYRLKPGHYFLFKDGKLDIKEYYKYEFKKKKTSKKSLINNIKKEIKESVEYHKISDVKVGSFLSGGVDSSYITALLHPNQTFSVGFKNKGFNETEYASMLSQKLNIKNKKEYITADQFFSVLEDVQYYSDEPHANLSAVPLYFLAKLAKPNVTVVLSGEGADELFCGYDAYNDSKYFKIYQILPFFIRKGIKNLIKDKTYFKGQGFLIKSGTKLEDYYIGQAFIFDDDEANKVLSKEYKSNLSFKDITRPIFAEVKHANKLVKMQYLDMKLWLPNDILLKADKMTMAHSIELRVPFLDKEVFNLSKSIPKKYKIKRGETKYALREASASVLPFDSAKRPKKGFPVPFSIWLKEEKYYNLVKNTFKSDYAKKFFNQKEILDLLDRHYLNIENTGRRVYTIYSFLLWYKKYFIDM